MLLVLHIAMAGIGIGGFDTQRYQGLDMRGELQGARTLPERFFIEDEVIGRSADQVGIRVQLL